MTFNHLLIGIENKLASLVLNRPQEHNALNEELMQELRLAFTKLDQDKNVKVIVLKANGPSFCAGADLKWMKSAAQKTHEQNVEEANQMASLFHEIQNLSKPVVAFVHGAILGGGVGLVSVCDIVLAEESSRFGLTEVKLGLAPSVISPFVIQKMGASYARRLFLTGEFFNASFAQKIGLVHEIYNADTATQTLAFVCQHLLQNAPNAMAEIKDLIAMNLTLAPSELNDYTTNQIALLRNSDEGQEGLQAFFEKRKPNYS